MELRRFLAVFAVSLCLALPGVFARTGHAADLVFHIPDFASAFQFEDRYYDNYGAYKQAQWEHYNHDRARMLERERTAARAERLRMEQERLAWERREQERLQHDQKLHAQWEHEREHYMQQRRHTPP
ncbi:MAG: hypothetical protein FWG59_02215, partial [Betaproteobacteria bacterium]|nr:hypothetical protein [Betaproteobacteria bacterium]